MGVRYGLHRYPYFNHLIQFWPGGWVKPMEKINEMVGMKNYLLMSGEKKCLWLVHIFHDNSFVNILVAFYWQVPMR